MPALMRLRPLSACTRTQLSPLRISPAARRRFNLPGPSDLDRPTVIARAGDRKDEGLGSFLSESEETRLISFAVAIGISGSAAVLGSRLAGIELFSSFHWEAERIISDFKFALELFTPIVLLDAAVLFPKFHTDTEPVGGLKQTAQESTQKLLQRLRSDLLPASGPMGDIRAASTLFQIVAAGVEEESQMSKPAQLSLELAYIWLRDFTSELLQRGLIVAFLSGWLLDRAFEAGMDDVAVIAPGQLPFYTSEVAQLAAATIMTTITMPAVFSQALATRAAVASFAAFVTVRGIETDEKLDSWLLEWRMIEALAIQEKALPAEAAFTITVVRGVMRNCLLNAIFIIRGNLAASLLVAFLSDFVQFSYCELVRATLPSLKSLQQDPKD